MKQKRDLVADVLKYSGIHINGNRPRDLQIDSHDLGLFANELLTRGNLGLGELYERGIWDCDDVQAFYRHLLEGQVYKYPLYRPLQIVSRPASWPALIQLWALYGRNIYRHTFRNLQAQNPYEIGEAHYDKVDNVLDMLGPYRAYSCGHWKEASTLKEAQEEKFALLCEKMQLSTANRVLDVGCGWGSLMKYAVDNYNVEAVGITVSSKQAQYINQKLGDEMQAFVLDYRLLKPLYSRALKELTERARKSQDKSGHLPELLDNLAAKKPAKLQALTKSFSNPFDAVVSVGMFEHVGPSNYKTYAQSVQATLKQGGRFVLQTIAVRRASWGSDPWIEKYIFPRSKLPIIKQAQRTIKSALSYLQTYDFADPITNLKDAFYTRTIEAWKRKLKEAYANGQVDIGENVYRRLMVYLHMSAAKFSADFPGRATVIQVVGQKN